MSTINRTSAEQRTGGSLLPLRTFVILLCGFVAAGLAGVATGVVVGGATSLAIGVVAGASAGIATMLGTVAGLHALVAPDFG